MRNLLKSFWVVHGLEHGSPMSSKMVQPLMETVYLLFVSSLFFVFSPVAAIKKTIETQRFKSLGGGS